jgi:hypothetical protein
MHFKAMQQFFSLSEVASKILPALSPLTFDQDKQVFFMASR